VKSKGRLIGIIAALGLLLSLVSVGTVGAATGKVALDATYYSDKDTFNIVTASITDADLSAQRTGKVRFTDVSASTTTFAVTAGVIEGELAKTDTFNRAGGDAVQTLTLTKGGTDKDKSGALTVADVTLKVNGTAVTPDSVTVVSNKITAVVLPAANNDAAGTSDVTVAYQYTEYDSSNTAATPVDLLSLQVLYGAGTGNESNQVLAMGVTQSTGTITVGSVPAIPANSEVLITFGYDVADSVTKNVTLSSNTSVAAGKNRSLTGAETSATSGIFASKVALFTGGDLAKIESESQDSANDLAANGGDADGTVQVDELNATTGLGTDLNTRVQAASTALGLAVSTTSAADFLKQALPVADGDSITATYVDASPSATLTKSSTADLAAPVVTLVSPTDKLYTSETLITLSADVVDSGAGVAQTAITMAPPAGNTFNTILQPIQSGFRVSSSPTAAIGEGAKTWFVATKDKVGNIPAKDTSTGTAANNADRGAAPFGDTTADNAFAFTVDTSGPEVSTAITGLKLKNAGVTTGTKAETQTTDSRTWVRLLFTLGTGGAPIDATSVAASDFTVAGVAPVSVLVNTVAHDSAATVVGSAVYLEVSEMDTDARPKVVVVGEIKDKAGNARTSGTITAAADQLSPVLTATTDVALGQKSVTITVSSSEALVVNPTISITATKPAAGVVASLVAQTVTSVSSTSWTAKVTNAADAASKQYIVVTGTDIPGNAATIGDDSPAKDLTSFQLDYAAPTVTFTDAGGSSLSGTSEEEGAVWIVATFDEDEYTGDTNKTVTVNTMSLENDDDVVIADDVTELFTDDNINFTLAKTLVPDTYTFDMKATDSAGNAVTATQITFTVTKKVAYSLVLKPGVNLVSIPGTPVGDAGSLDVLFDELPVTSVSTYDNAAGTWLTSTYDAAMAHFMGDITAIEPGKAYFVTTTAKTTAKAMLEAPGVALPPTVPLLQGFNAVGFWNIDDSSSTADMDAYLSSVSWSVAYAFDPTPGAGWEVIRPDGNLSDDVEAAEGKGYFVYLTADGTLTP